MDKLRVAVYVEQNCLPTEGGGYTYYQAFVKEIDEHTFPEEIAIHYLLPSSANSIYPFRKKTLIAKQVFTDRILFVALNKIYHIIHRLIPNESSAILESLSVLVSKIINRNAVRVLKKSQIDLVYYLKPNDHPMNFPMIVTHWDVGHRSMYPFPEVASNGNFGRRELYYIKMLHRALLILCESMAGAAELRHYYPVNEKKIKVLPLFAGEVVNLQVGENEQQEILRKCGLKSNSFFLYPAQFWAHKNHFNLVMGFKKVMENAKHREIRLVLCGADQGNMTYIKKLVSSLQLERNVIFTGFINNRVLYTFYRNAIGLVMPTYLGPTNLPLIEAATLNCAVACSDLEGHHEILGDSALYFDPADATGISNQMNELFDPATRAKLQQDALGQISSSAFHVSKSLKVLERILLEIRPVRKTWGVFAGVLQLITCANIGIIDF